MVSPGTLRNPWARTNGIVTCWEMQWERGITSVVLRHLSVWRHGPMPEMSELPNRGFGQSLSIKGVNGMGWDTCGGFGCQFCPRTKTATENSRVFMMSEGRLKFHFILGCGELCCT